MVFDSTSSPSPLLQNERLGLKVPSHYSRLVPLATRPILKCFSKVAFNNINPVVVERDLLWKTRRPFSLYGSEMILGTQNRRPNIITKDAPITLITREIPKVWWAVSQALWMKTKYIWKVYFGFLKITILQFIIDV